jgi:ATP-binding cassette subfamily C protein
MGVVAAFALATNLLLLTLPLYMLQIYDRVLPAQSGETLAFLTLIAVAAIVVLAVLEAARSILAQRAAAAFDVAMSEPAIRATLRLGPAAGGAQALRDVTALRNLIASRLLFNLFDLPFAPVFIGLLYLIHPALFWWTLAGAAILVAIAAANEVATHNANRRNGEQAILAGRRADELTRAADSVLAMGMASDTIADWGNIRREELVAAENAGRINSLFSGLSRFVRLGLQIAVLGYGARLVLAGEMTAGMIFASSLISGRGLQPVDQAIGSWRQLAAGWQAWVRLRAFVPKGSVAAGGRREPPQGRVEARNLVVPHPLDPNRPPILRGISLDLAPGTATAVIGPSGSGKSTLARVLAGTLKPKGGTVRIDGHELAAFDAEVLGRHVGYVGQDSELFGGTVAQNIARFRPDATQEEIAEAARAAHCEDAIKRLVNGYETRIGQGGARLSGGERQCIAFARALFGRPELLILDEPNASLDREGETSLFQAIDEQRKRGATVFFITQRDFPLSAVDRVLRLEAGAVAELRDSADILRARRDNAPANAPAQVKSGFAQTWRAGAGTRQ